jgi:hypothetical protein
MTNTNGIFTDDNGKQRTDYFRSIELPPFPGVKPLFKEEAADVVLFSLIGVVAASGYAICRRYFLVPQSTSLSKEEDDNPLE